MSAPSSTALATPKNANTFKRALPYFALMALLALVATFDVSAAEGLEKVNESIEKVKSVLQLAAAGVVTIAIMFAGFKMGFQKSGVMEVMPIIIGGLLIGAASYIASFLVG
jgi:type IV secretion system protein VirB2